MLHPTVQPLTDRENIIRAITIPNFVKKGFYNDREIMVEKADLPVSDEGEQEPAIIQDSCQ